jgi:isopenicillin N synthase-like dioxygenase
MVIEAIGAMGAYKLKEGTLPVIDVGGFRTDNRAEFEAMAHRICKACRDNGFFYIVNHGIPDDLIAEMYNQSKAFHHQPGALKDGVHVRHSFGNRGWFPATDEDTDPDPELYCLSEPEDPKRDQLGNRRLYSHFGVGLELPIDDPDHQSGNLLLGPNQWPNLSGFRQVVSTYYSEMIGLSQLMFKAFACGLGMPDDFFDEMIKKPPSELRLLHYPQNLYPVDRDHLGIAAHSDFECFTILSTSGPGLQVMSTKDEWVEAPPVVGALAVNIGDMLEALTNGTFKATQHRVANPQGVERFSLAFFAAADYDTVIEPLSQFVTPDNPPRYQSIIAGHHLANFVIQDTKHLRRKVKLGIIRPEFELLADNPFSREAIN